MWFSDVALLAGTISFTLQAPALYSPLTSGLGNKPCLKCWRAAAAAPDSAMLPSFIGVAPTDGRSERAALAACAARRRLARNAASVKVVQTRTEEAASAWMGLVSCLPALERVTLRLVDDLAADQLSCLLEALAWCPRLRALALYVCLTKGGGTLQRSPALKVPSFAKLRSLTALTLVLWGEGPPMLADVVDALVSLAGLAVLVVGNQPHACCICARRSGAPAGLAGTAALRCPPLHP